MKDGDIEQYVCEFPFNIAKFSVWFILSTSGVAAEPFEFDIAGFGRKPDFPAEEDQLIMVAF